jgi:hypothetical protein
VLLEHGAVAEIVVDRDAGIALRRDEELIEAANPRHR